MSTSLTNRTRHELLEFFGLGETAVQARGTTIRTEGGQTLIDFVGQFGAVPFGYAPTEILSAARAFLDSEQPAFVQPLLNPEAERLARRLIEIAPGSMSRVNFATSGAETVEAAIKLTRASTRRELIIGTCTGFHGKTLGAVNVTGKPAYREAFQVRTDGYAHVPYGDLDALERVLKSGRAAAFFVEPVQGEAGMITPPPGYLAAAQALCRRHGALFVVDEIQTGLGRTGHLFAAEAEDLEPDVLLLAKALGGGVVPIGACIYNERAWSREFDRHHSSTFAVNGFSAAIGLAVIETLTCEGGRVVERIAQVGNYLGEQLDELVRRHPDVFAGVDGRGLMRGLKFRNWSGERLYMLSLASSFGALIPIVCGYLKAVHGLHCLPTLNQGNVLRIQPAYCIRREDIDRLVEGLDAAAELIASADQHRLILHAHGFSPNRSAVRRPGRRRVERTTTRPGRCLGRFAFLLHPTTQDCVNGDEILAALDMSADETRFLGNWLADFSEWAKPDLEAGVSYHANRICNAQGDYVEGWLVGSLLQPRDLMRLSPSRRKKLLDAYLETVHGLDIDFVGLGAYTSVITGAGLDIVNDRFRTTTGNSLTAMVGVDALAAACNHSGTPLAERTTGVVGAYGSVGRLASLRLSRFAEHLVLLGNAANRDAMQELRRVAGEVYVLALRSLQAGRVTGTARALAALLPDPGWISTWLAHDVEDETRLCELHDRIESMASERQMDPPVVIASDLTQWLPRLDAVVSATSNGASFLDSALLRGHCVVCDCAQPPDIAPSAAAARPDVWFIEGGLIRMPDPSYRFGSQNLTRLPTGMAFSCLAETIVLTMAGKRRDYSIGKRPSIEDAEEIFELAQHFGFSTACVQPTSKAA